MKAPYRLVLDVYHDFLDTPELTQTKFEKHVDEMGVKVQNYNEIDEKKTVIDVTLDSDNYKDAVNFFKKMKNVRAKGRQSRDAPQIFRGYTFNVKLGIPFRDLDTFADEATEDFARLEKELGYDGAIE